MIVDRIKGLARLPGSRLRAADENFRTHDDRQRKVLRGLLAEIGMVGAVLVWVPDDMARAALRSAKDFAAWLASYEDTFQLIDCHMRAEELKGQNIPVLGHRPISSRGIEGARHVRPSPSATRPCAWR